MMANENYVAMTEGVKLFLESIGLEQHFSMFIAKGFDMESDIPNLSNADLDELQVLDANHRSTILKSAATFKLSAAFRVFEWLRSHGLDHYYINFLRADLTDLDDIARFNLPDPELYDELEIVLPGHKGRLERAVQELRKKRRLPDDVEVPVCQGWWGRPPLLPHACYDFLCVEATIASPHDPSNSFVIEFMVDSGSDVTTVREEVLAQLGLEVLGTVRSQGVHSARRKLLHRALLRLGDTSMEIEVLGESYDSLGSRVVRNFRHFINGTTHLWLKGDYNEHHIAPLPSAPSSSHSPRLALPMTTEPCPSPEASPHATPLPVTASDQGTQLSLRDAANEESPPFTMDFHTLQSDVRQPADEGEEREKVERSGIGVDAAGKCSNGLCNHNENHGAVCLCMNCDSECRHNACDSECQHNTCDSECSKGSGGCGHSCGEGQMLESGSSSEGTPIMSQQSDNRGTEDLQPSEDQECLPPDKPPSPLLAPPPLQPLSPSPPCQPHQDRTPSTSTAK